MPRRSAALTDTAHRFETRLQRGCGSYIRTVGRNYSHTQSPRCAAVSRGWLRLPPPLGTPVDGWFVILRAARQSAYPKSRAATPCLDRDRQRRHPRRCLGAIRRSGCGAVLTGAAWDFARRRQRLQGHSLRRLDGGKKPISSAPAHAALDWYSVTRRVTAMRRRKDKRRAGRPATWYYAHDAHSENCLSLNVFAPAASRIARGRSWSGSTAAPGRSAAAARRRLRRPQSREARRHRPRDDQSPPGCLRLSEARGSRRTLRRPGQCRDARSWSRRCNGCATTSPLSGRSG